MKTLLDPNRQEFVDAIDTAGKGVISDEWKDSAWAAINTWIVGMWIVGRLASSPYGFPVPMRLWVVWEWEKGDLTVNIFRV